MIKSLHQELAGEDAELDDDDDDPLAHLLAEERSAAVLPSKTPDEAAAALAADFPRCVRLPNLRVLDLSSNQLLSMPPWLPPSLKVLFMSRNTLMSIPDWATMRLTNLQVRMIPTFMPWKWNICPPIICHWILCNLTCSFLTVMETRFRKCQGVMEALGISPVQMRYPITVLGTIKISSF